MTGPLVGLAAVLGLAVGSFLNVLVHRVPAGMSVAAPRSACPTCRAQIAWYDNVPVVSWLVLRGRCRRCGTRISPRYLVVEVLTGVLFALMTWSLLDRDLVAAVPAYLYVTAIGIALAFIDVEHHRLPDAIVLPSYPVVGLLLVAASWGDGDWSRLLSAGVGGVGLWVLYFGLALVKPGGMGFGDVKLAGILGAALGWCGWGAFAVGAFAAFLVGGVVAIALMLAGQATRTSRVPFGPWMVVGALIGVLTGEGLWSAYLGAFA